MWGFATAYMDFMVFSGQWQIEAHTAKDAAFWSINLLVLGFLFGERAVRNVMPIIGQYFGKVPAS